MFDSLVPGPFPSFSMFHSKKQEGLVCKILFSKGCSTPFISFASSMQAMVFLYDKGFPMLGHVQSGNIFVDENGVCKLGGYENTIVGYKTRLYRLCRNNLQHFDVVMFGTYGVNIVLTSSDAI